MASELESIEKLASVSSQESAEKLQEIELTSGDRGLRKAARKALYRLSLAGIVPSKRHVADIAAPEDVDNLRAFASAFDGAGNRLILFLIHDPDGGSVTLLQILTNDSEGVKNCESLKFRRREVDERIERIKTQVETGLAVAEISADYGRRLLTDSRALTASLSKRTPTSLLAWIGKIGNPIEEYSPPIYTQISKEAINKDNSIPTDPADLFKLQWFDPWFFAAEDTMPWLPQWEQTLLDGGEDPDMGPGTPLYNIASEAAPLLMTDSMRKLYTVRLEESADVLWRCGKEAEAKQAVYHALALKSSSNTVDIPFVHTIALRTLGAAFEMVKAYRERRAGG